MNDQALFAKENEWMLKAADAVIINARRPSIVLKAYFADLLTIEMSSIQEALCE